LAKEFRQLLLQHQRAKAVAPVVRTQSQASSERSSGDTTPTRQMLSTAVVATTPATAAAFGGIEAAALSSRAREKVVAAHPVWVEDSSDATPPLPSAPASTLAPLNGNTTTKRRLRWHAMIDSGMGRLGFKTDYPQNGERRDTVDILQELVNAELAHNAPVGESVVIE